MDQTKQPVVVKKYANRRLYNTETSTYVTLEDLATMVRSERDFVVYDAKTNEDLTHSVLTQIILEQESRGQNLLPVNFLRQLIRFYGDNMGRLVPAYLDLSLGMLTREQEKFRKQITETWGAGPFGTKPFGTTPFGTAALEAMQDQARQNMQLFEKTFASMWAPFTQATAAANAAAKNGADGEGHAVEPGHSDRDDVGTSDAAELSELKDQLVQMQRRLDRLSRGG